MGLKRKRLEKFCHARFFLWFDLVSLLLPHAAEAFNEHICADYAEHQHICHLYNKVCIPRRLENFNQLHAEKPSGKTPDEKIKPHLEIHVAYLPVGVRS